MVAVGFERDTAMVYVRQLLASRVQVSIRKQDKVKVLRLRRPAKHVLPPCAPVDVPVDALFDGGELERLRNQLLGTRFPFNEVSSPDAGEAAGQVFVYEVGSDWYGVDWELTSISLRGVVAMALYCRANDTPIHCYLVEPRPRRGHAQAYRPVVVEVAESLEYGQLRLAL